MKSYNDSIEMWEDLQEEINRLNLSEAQECIKNLKAEIVHLVNTIESTRHDLDEYKKTDLGRENKRLKQDVRLWKKRVDEVAECVKDYEEIKAKNKELKKELYDVYTLLDSGSEKHRRIKSLKREMRP